MDGRESVEWVVVWAWYRAVGGDEVLDERRCYGIVVIVDKWECGGCAKYIARYLIEE